MKKLILAIATTFLVMSCSTSDKEQMFEKSKKYLDGKLNKEDGKGVFAFKSVDTIIELSSKDLEMIKRIPLVNEINENKKSYDQFNEIDKQFDAGGENEQARYYRLKVEELQDSLRNWMEKDDLLDSTNVAAYKCNVNAEGTEIATGAKMKDIKMVVFFDKEKDVDAELNALIYDR